MLLRSHARIVEGLKRAVEQMLSVFFFLSPERVLSKIESYANVALCCNLQAAVAFVWLLPSILAFRLAWLLILPANVSLFPLANSIFVLRASCIACYENNHNQCVQSVCTHTVQCKHKSGDDAKPFFIFYLFPLPLHGVRLWFCFPFTLSIGSVSFVSSSLVIILGSCFHSPLFHQYTHLHTFDEVRRWRKNILDSKVVCNNFSTLHYLIAL